MCGSDDPTPAYLAMLGVVAVFLGALLLMFDSAFFGNEPGLGLVAVTMIVLGLIAYIVGAVWTVICNPGR